MAETKENEVLSNIANVVERNAKKQARSLEEVGVLEDKRPSLRMKSIATWNVWGMPWYSRDLSKRMKQWSAYLHDSMAENQQLGEEDLVVGCVQEAWGYRVGALGWPVMWAGYKNSACCDTHGIAGLLNKKVSRDIHANDHELLSGVWSVGTRALPFLNAGVWDPKRTISRGLVSRNKELISLQRKAEQAAKKAEEAENKAKKVQESKIETMRKKAEEARELAEKYARLAREAEEKAIRDANSVEEVEEVEAVDENVQEIKDEDNEDKDENKEQGEEVKEDSTPVEESKEGNDGKEKPSRNKPLTLCYSYGAGSNNKSVSSMFDIRSIAMKPLLDSGCAIYANKPAREHGFERWNTWGDSGWMEDMANKGIVWAYFEAPNRKQGICVLTLHVAGASPQGTDVAQLKQLVLLKAKLEQRFSSRVMTYETYVAGDFNIEFNKRHEDDVILEKWNILRRCGFTIISESNLGSTSASDKEIDYVMYAPDEINHEDTLKDLSVVRSMFEEKAYDTRPVKETELSDHWLVRVDVEYGNHE